MKPRDGWLWIAAAIVLASPGIARAQHEHMHMMPPDTTAKAHEHAMMPGHEHMMMAGHEHTMPALYGPYPSTREASGTSWQPESAPHEALHAMRGDWSLMLHGFAFLVGDRQGGPRGDGQLFSSNMVMGIASRPLGAGRLGLRAMMSLEPATIGKDGYPLLLQTGETADGASHLIDRQHPHDLFMELAGSYSVSSGRNSAFLYAGLPGEPALGPPAFMHRVSGLLDPESPVSHHWLDSSHITFGVLTLGGVRGAWKAEASSFRGREPDQDRWNVETPKLDSYSGRLSWNPSPDWSFQSSAGWLESPEQLSPLVDTDRITASAIWNGHAGARDASAMLAWGRNINRPGATLDAWLLEGTLGLGDRHTLIARAERVEKDELFPEADPRAGQVFTVGRIEAGVLARLLRRGHGDVGLGALGSVSVVPRSLRSVYGDTPLSGSLFLRAALH